MYVDLLWIDCGLRSIFCLSIHWTSNHSTFGKLTWPHQTFFALQTWMVKWNREIYFAPYIDV